MIEWAHDGQSRTQFSTRPSTASVRAGDANRSSLARLGLPVALAALLVLSAGACAKSVEEQLAEVRVQQEIGSYTESVETLRAVLDKDPNNPEANLLLGQAQIALGQPALAIWPLELATRVPEFSNLANLSLGSAFMQLEQYGPAIEAADRVLDEKSAPVDMQAGALRLRAAIHLADKDFDGVLADVERLQAVNPGDTDGFALRANALLGLGRAEEAAASMLEIWDSPTLGQTDAAIRAGIGLVKVYQYQLEDPEKADAQLTAVLERFPGKRIVLLEAIAFYDRLDQPERSVELLQKARERDPSDIWLVGQLAERLVKLDRGDEARALAKESVELLDTPSAWITLSMLERMLGNYDDAIFALEKTFSMLPGVPDNLLFKHADLLVDAGQLDRADEVASGIKEDFYRQIIQARIEFERGNNEKALELVTAGLKKWPNNTGARYLAAKAAMRLGRVDRAMAELREATRVNEGDSDAAIELAWIQLQQGKPQAALGTTRLVMKSAKGDRYWRAARLAARAQWEMGEKQEARKSLEAMAKEDTQRLAATVDLAELDSEMSGPQAGVKTLLASGLDLQDPANESALRALAQYEVSAGQGEKALSRVDEIIAQHPDVAAYHELRARVLGNLDRSDESAAAFARALELDPKRASALEGQATLAEAAGDTARARDLLDRAAATDEDNAEYAYAAAQIALASGDTDGAVQRLETALSRNPLHAKANNDLAWILAERGQDLDRALVFAQRARAGDDSAAVLDTLGWVQLKRGEAADAVTTLEQAHALDPGSPSISYRLGLALAQVGESDRARSLWEKALASGPFPESTEAQDQLARLDAGRS